MGSISIHWDAVVCKRLSESVCVCVRVERWMSNACMCSRVVCDLPLAVPEGWTCSDNADASQRPTPPTAFIYSMFAITQNSLLCFLNTLFCFYSVYLPVLYLHTSCLFFYYVLLLSPHLSLTLLLSMLFIHFLTHFLLYSSPSFFLPFFFSSSLSPSSVLQELGIACLSAGTENRQTHGRAVL